MRPHILIIDDNEPLRDMLATVFSFEGWEATQAYDGQDGFEKYKKDPDKYTVISMDMDMPRMNGAESLAKILEINPKAQVAMCSSHTLEAQAARCPGAQAFLRKPVDVAQIIRVFCDLIANHNAENPDTAVSIAHAN